MSLSVYVEAEYESGYIHRENESDRSSYVRDKNTFFDILEGMPCEVHGRMTRFSAVIDDGETVVRHDVDWTRLPDNARPIRFKQMEGDFMLGGVVDSRIVQVDFGYQYNDPDGRNVQEVVSIP